MHALTILSTLRSEISHAERLTTQAWQQYAQAHSHEALLQAVDVTRQAIDLHRQLAQRLEQLVGAPRRTATVATPEATTPLAPCAA